MKRGAFFEECGSDGEQTVFRLRWREDMHQLSHSERNYWLFIRYLINRGKLSEGWGPPPNSGR